MKRKHKKPQRDLLGLILLITLGVMTVALVFLFAYLLPHGPDLKRDSGSGLVPPFISDVAAARPLPVTVDPDRFQEPMVKRAYATAREKPAVLAQQPCYCGCSRQGHRSLLDCFQDVHAAGCSICIREANYARESDAHGKSAEEIRTGIIRGDWKNLERWQ